MPRRAVVAVRESTLCEYRYGRIRRFRTGPSARFCSLCPVRTKAVIVRLRPTGPGNSLQRWGFCESCAEIDAQPSVWTPRNLSSLSAIVGYGVAETGIGGQDMKTNASNRCI
jgi:hypothetical protein